MSLRREILYAVCALAFALDVAAAVMWSDMGDGCFIMLRRQMACIEVPPMQYRIMAAWIFKLFNVGGQELRTPCILLATLAIFAYLYGTRALVFQVFGQSDKSYAMSFIFWPLLPVLYFVPLVHCCWLYDLIGVAVMSWGLFFILKRQWFPYLILFTVATFNRETTCFLTLFYLVLEFRRDNWRRVGMFCLLQAGLWLAVKLFLRWHFSDCTPDDITEGTMKTSFFHMVFFTNIQVLLGIADGVMPGSTSRAWLQFAALFGGLWIPIVMFWRDWWANQIIKRLMFVVPVYAAGMFMVGAIDELRIFAEITPVIGLAYLSILAYQPLK